MAQPKVNEFFSTRKRRDAHPAKRRKVELYESINSEFVERGESTLLTRQNPKKELVQPSSKSTKDSNADLNDHSAKVVNTEENRTSDSSKAQTAATCLGKSNSNVVKIFQATKSCDDKLSPATKLGSLSRSRPKSKRSTKSKKPISISNQTKITELMPCKVTSESKSESKSSEDASISDCGSVLSQADKNTKVEGKVISEEITSFQDDNYSPSSSLSTPRKRTLRIEATTEPPKTRKCKVPVRRITSESECTTDESKTAKKKLDLDPTCGSDKCTTPTMDNSSIQNQEKLDETEPEQQDSERGKRFLLRLVSEVESPEKPVSPLAMTPVSSDGSSTPESQGHSPSPEPASPKLQNLSQKLKALSQMNGKALKNRLKQSGKLGDMKQKLDDLGKAIDKTEEAEPAQDEVDGDVSASIKQTEEDKLPAYQRFEHLTKEGKPTLTLPFSYKSLEGAFQAMDTVVSMLHNRSELCTFSKLKAAVQNLTKKNFEEKIVGQIKTVAPAAYIFRQEKNVCLSNNKKGYALTIEPDLSKEVSEDNDKKAAKTPEGKPVFSASALISRKRTFHNSLLGLVMKQHKAFLASLSPPMNIPDSKITRWHPRFRLDEVSPVISSPLPQPPEVRVYQSAKDVLQSQHGRLNPRIEEALAKVAAENEKNQARFMSPNSKSPASTSNTTATSPSMKGIPPALLAKIRAKEALKAEMAMTRNPEEETKLKMMGHLPEMIRIIRSFFVTEKRPALPIEAVYKKLEDSYRTGISRKDVEQHVKLLVSVAPELVTLVEIKRGHFLKLDRNVDVQAISTRISKLVQDSK